MSVAEIWECFSLQRHSKALDCWKKLMNVYHRKIYRSSQLNIERFFAN